MMDTIEKYYFELGIETEAQKYKKFYEQAVIDDNWVDIKTAIGNYEETFKDAKRFLGQNSNLVGELEAKLEKMEAKKQW